MGRPLLRAHLRRLLEGLDRALVVARLAGDRALGHPGLLRERVERDGRGRGRRRRASRSARQVAKALLVYRSVRNGGIAVSPSRTATTAILRRPRWSGAAARAGPARRPSPAARRPGPSPPGRPRTSRSRSAPASTRRRSARRPTSAAAAGPEPPRSQRAGDRAAEREHAAAPARAARARRASPARRCGRPGRSGRRRRAPRGSCTGSRPRRRRRSGRRSASSRAIRQRSRRSEPVLKLKRLDSALRSGVPSLRNWSSFCADPVDRVARGGHEPDHADHGHARRAPGRRCGPNACDRLRARLEGLLDAAGHRGGDRGEHGAAEGRTGGARQLAQRRRQADVVGRGVDVVHRRQDHQRGGRRKQQPDERAGAAGSEDDVDQQGARRCRARSRGSG